MNDAPYLDLNVFAAELTAISVNLRFDDDDVAGGDDDDDGWSPYGDAPPGAPPAYRAAEAEAMANESSDDEPPATPPRRPRYLDDVFDDEAAEGR